MHGIEDVLSQLIMEPGIWGALGLLVVSAVDEIAAPLPSSLILVGEVAFLKDPITLHFLPKLAFFVGAPIALGTTVGSFFIYWAAYAGGKPALSKLVRKFRISEEKLNSYEERFMHHRYDEPLLFALRATPLVPTMPVTVVSGIVRMKPWRYVVLTFLGIFARVMITLVLLRYTIGVAFLHSLA